MATVQKYKVHTFMSFYVMNTEMNNDRTHLFFKMSSHHQVSPDSPSHWDWAASADYGRVLRFSDHLP